MRLTFKTRAQSTFELLIVLFAGAMALLAIGTLISRGFNANVKDFSDTLEDSTNTLKPAQYIPKTECTCDPPQGASGWRCGAYPCGVTERLVTTTCTPSGCGVIKGVKEQLCVSDSECCTEFMDTNFCGTGGSAPDCAIGERIIQKTCGLDTVNYECRPDTNDPSVDGSPSCLPHCIGEYSPNEAAAIANPTLPVICPGDDLSLNKETGPWARDRSGVGKLTKILGQGVSVCRHPPSPLPDEKCETYCLSGYLPNRNGLTCDPIGCQNGPLSLNTPVAEEDLPQDATRNYSFTIPDTCPMIDNNSYITFNIILKEATVQFWDHDTSSWDSPSTSGDNNNLFQSFKLFPLGADRKYFDGGIIQWAVSQAAGDQDGFGVSIMAVECAAPPMPQNITIQNPNEELTGESDVVRSFKIPEECILIDESSYFSVNVQLVNATLKVYDANADTWSELATSGADNRQSLVLKYRPLGLQNRFFRGDQIAWKITKARGSTGTFKAGITVNDCYLSLCSGTNNTSWINVAAPTSSCASVCASADLSPGISPEGMSCASGENRPMSGTGTISYTHDCANGLGCNGNLPGPVQTHFFDVYCYRNGQNEDGQPTDLTVACFCQE